MAACFSDFVRFRDDKLFNGAVSIDWFSSDPEQSRLASECFVFHGPEYHGVSQEDVGDGHGHRLVDTATFTNAVIRRCYGFEDQPFTLAIAGYGTGKSHLGVTLAQLLSQPEPSQSRIILDALNSADATLAASIHDTLGEAKPCLVLALNGMRGSNLAAEMTSQLSATLKRAGHDTSDLDNLRPRFAQAASLIDVSNDAVRADLVAHAEVESVDALLEGLKAQDEAMYAKVYDFFAERGMPIAALSGESVRDVIDITTREYCGQGKPYQSLLILFDEFGKYTEFATIRSQIAGNGALQELFEGVQANSSTACFVGFIQFELNAYVQRIAPEYKNEILRYISRYQTADRVYLSINLETLIANLIEKRKTDELQDWFTAPDALVESESAMSDLCRWYPHSKNYQAWTSRDAFHSVIRKGCWPLAPSATWLLFYLASAGKHLQERSALALLGDVFKRFGAHSPEDIGPTTTIPAVSFCSDMLVQELISSEEMGQQGSVAHSYTAVISKHGSRLTRPEREVLQAVLLASKLGLVSRDREDAICALATLAGRSAEDVAGDVTLLQTEYNVIEWDEAFKAFDILGDAVPRTQFLAFIRQRVALSYDEQAKAALFASRASEWCDLLADIECDFAEEQKIFTREWKYQAVTTNLDYLPQQLKMAADRWATAFDVETCRGTVAYCYVGPTLSAESIEADAKKLLRSAAKESGASVLPILVVLLHDAEGHLGQALAELAVIEEADAADKAKFGNLVGAQQEKLLRSIREEVSAQLKNRHFIIGLNEEHGRRRLARVGSFLFERLYKKPLPFPFDGFTTSRGNAANTCYELTHELMHGTLDYNGVTAKPVQVQNRAVNVLRDSWGIFNKNGTVSRRPSNGVVRAATERFDDALATEQKLSVGDAIAGLCLPPYGANIASAGLLLGVYLAPRQDEIIVMDAGQQTSIADWLQSGIFKGKFLNLAALRSADLMAVGEASAEWETFLDEWEQAEDYKSRIDLEKRYEELRSRIPVPPQQVYRAEHLLSLSADASLEVAKQQEKVSTAWQKVERAQHHKDCGQVSWAANDLKTLLERMDQAGPCWTSSDVDEVRGDYAKIRQYAVQFFADWLPSQAPRSDSPDDVGDFKHRMLRKVGANLQRIGLDDEFSALEEYTKSAISRASQIARVNEALRSADGWLREHADAPRSTRISELRGLRDAGKQVTRELSRAASKTELQEVAEKRVEMDRFLDQLAKSEKDITDRASALWNSAISTYDDLDRLSVEIDALIHAFEGLETDLEDLLSMRKGLRLFQACYRRISDEDLSWEQLDASNAALTAECEKELSDEELPWDYEEVLGAFLSSVTEVRQAKSAEWIAQADVDSNDIETMDAANANQVLNRVSSPPVFVTDDHRQQAITLQEVLSVHLRTLSLDWLIEKFKELSEGDRCEFLRRIDKL